MRPPPSQRPPGGGAPAAPRLPESPGRSPRGRRARAHDVLAGMHWPHEVSGSCSEWARWKLCNESISSHGPQGFSEKKNNPRRGRAGSIPAGARGSDPSVVERVLLQLRLEPPPGEAELRGRGGPVSLRPIERRSEEHTSELQSQSNLVCRLL